MRSLGRAARNGAETGQGASSSRVETHKCAAGPLGFPLRKKRAEKPIKSRLRDSSSPAVESRSGARITILAPRC
jgi:hypothetical protein